MRGVPGVANGFTMIVKSDRTFHLSVDRAQQFLAENVSQDAADEHSHKQQEYDYEVLKKKMDFVNRPSRADILYLNKLQRLESIIRPASKV